MKITLSKLRVFNFDLPIYIILLILAFFMKWTAIDIMWSFWLSSLFFGLVLIPLGVLMNLIFSVKPRERDKLRIKDLFFLTAFGIAFTIAILSVFLILCGVVGILLTLAYPIPGNVIDIYKGINFLDILFYIFKEYWPFVIIAFLEERKLITWIMADGGNELLKVNKAVLKPFIRVSKMWAILILTGLVYSQSVSDIPIICASLALFCYDFKFPRKI